MSDELKTIKFQMMLAPSEAERLDDWGFGRRIRSRAEAIRRLCQIGLVYSAEAENLMKRNERALKALLLTIEKLSKADKEKLPKGIRGGIAVAIDEQLAAYRASVEAFINADSLSIAIEGVEIEELAKAAKNLVNQINWNEPTADAPATPPGLLDRLQDAIDERGPSDLSPSNDQMPDGGRQKGGKS